MVAPSNTHPLSKTSRNSQPPDAPTSPAIPPKPAPPSAEALLDLLRSSPMNPRQLADHFHCSLRDIDAALDDPDFLLQYKLQNKLALLQSRLTASESVANAVDKTIGIMNFAEKPEVARRAASSLIQMAGLPIRTSAQQPPAPLPEPPSPPQTPQDLAADLDHLAAAACHIRLKRIDGIDLCKVPDNIFHEFVDCIRAFYDKHNLPYTWGEFTS